MKRNGRQSVSVVKVRFRVRFSGSNTARVEDFKNREADKPGNRQRAQIQEQEVHTHKSTSCGGAAAQ